MTPLDLFREEPGLSATKRHAIKTRAPCSRMLYCMSLAACIEALVRDNKLHSLQAALLTRTASSVVCVFRDRSCPERLPSQRRYWSPTVRDRTPRVLACRTRRRLALSMLVDLI
jgi:hypothetical protein